MDQNLFLTSLTISGIKNIEKSITLDFYRKTIDKSFSFDDYKVKAIYGENGSGKTGIVLAVYILKNLIFNYRFLSDSANQDFLNEVVNKKTGSLYLECDFLSTMLPCENVYKYSVCIERDDSYKFVIRREALCARSAAYATSKFKTIYSVMNGELELPHLDESLANSLTYATTNLLLDRTFESAALSNNKVVDIIIRSDIKDHIMMLNLFSLSLITSFDEPDRPSNANVRTSYILKGSKEPPDGGEKTFKLYPKIDMFVGDKRLVRKEEFDAYEDEVHKLERFLRLFKPELESIEIEKLEDKEYYTCSLVMVYPDYKISLQYESTGINKLIRLFDYLSLAMDGKIVFIDEMDSNINDIYLCRIIEYFALYGNGQLCFTTHNTSPMSVLRNCKNSIDFLSSDNRIIPWRKNGNFSPEKLYRGGMIEYLPFNIEAEDFIGILGG